MSAKPISTTSPEGQVAAHGDPTSTPVFRVLLMEDDHDAARLARRRLEWSTLATFEVSHASDLSSGFRMLENGGFDAVLLDLSLPDGQGLSTIGAASVLTRHLPIVILTSADDDQLALTAVRAGAQGYLLKHREDSRSLALAILHAMERHRRACMSEVSAAAARRA